MEGQFELLTQANTLIDFNISNTNLQILRWDKEENRLKLESRYFSKNF